MSMETYGMQKVLSEKRMRKVLCLDYDKIRDVYLNRGGRHIGAIVKVNCAYPYLAYLSWRDKNHYFIKFTGFGIDRCLWKDLMTKSEYSDVRKVIIEYTKVDGRKLFYITDKEEWLDGIDVAYTKDTEEWVGECT